MIDAHHHFWRYNPEEYGWISESMSRLRRDFLPADLRRDAHAGGIGGVVSVQARQTVEETRWLLELAGQNDFIRGVVGWVPLVSAGVRAGPRALRRAPNVEGRPPRPSGRAG